MRKSTKTLLANAIEQIVEESKTSLIAAAEALSSSGISNVSQGEAPEEISDSDISDEVRREYIEPLPKEELQSLSEKLIVETIKEQMIKDKLKEATKDAHEKGIFGAPTFMINNKIFWGQDRLEYALDEYSS